MVAKEAVVTNSLGIHARPAALLVKVAANFDAEIFLSKGNTRRVNGKSIMGVMMLAAEQGAKILVEAEGTDEAEAATEIAQIIADDFEDIT